MCRSAPADLPPTGPGRRSGCRPIGRGRLAARLMDRCALVDDRPRPHSRCSPALIALPSCGDSAERPAPHSRPTRGGRASRRHSPGADSPPTPIMPLRPAATTSPWVPATGPSAQLGPAGEPIRVQTLLRHNPFWCSTPKRLSGSSPPPPWLVTTLSRVLAAGNPCRLRLHRLTGQPPARSSPWAGLFSEAAMQPERHGVLRRSLGVVIRLQAGHQLTLTSPAAARGKP